MRRRGPRLARPAKRVRTPTRLSHEGTECGAVALAIVFEHFGSYLPLTRLRQECGVSRDGSNASNILRAARAHGFDARGFRKEPEELARMQMPVIIHWEFNHFLVLEGFGKEHVYLNDPFCGPRSVTRQKFERAFTGVTLVIKPAPGFVPEGRRPALLRTLLQRLSGSTPGLWFVVLAGLCLALPGVLIPAFSQIFVDEILIGGKRDWLAGLFAGMALTAALRAALTWLQRSYLLKLLIKLGVGMSSAFLWHVLRLPVTFFYARSPGDLANRVQLNDVVASTLSDQLSRGILDLLLVAFYALMMFYYDPALTLIGFATAAVHIALLRLGDRMRRDLSRLVAHEDGKLGNLAVSGLQMIETIKATGSEADFFGHWAGYQARKLSAQETLARREQWLRALVEALSRTNALLVLGCGALRVMDGQLSIGGLVAFEGLMASFIAPIEGLSQFGASLQRLHGRVERLDDASRHPSALPPDAPPPRAAQPRALSGALEVQGISFGYVPHAPALLEDLQLRLAPGQRVALVGGTGSGKSTIAKLVAGLYAPWSGAILFDGAPREQLPRELLSTATALVDQDIALFEGTIRDNLTLWDDTIPEADIVQAAKDACIHEVISELPGGYDARLSEGGYNLSGGQRQRLEIARALTRQPALLVLDEATSSLDTETERRVDENLRRRGCSCLLIAHRLSTIRDCDEILVLERGRVVQRGSHDRLLAQGGLYAALIQAS
jgi:NHLM bacteriocin system ABC transporter peptidase/ATP-binding protein